DSPGGTICQNRTGPSARGSPRTAGPGAGRARDSWCNPPALRWWPGRPSWPRKGHRAGYASRRTRWSWPPAAWGWRPAGGAARTGPSLPSDPSVEHLEHLGVVVTVVQRELAVIGRERRAHPLGIARPLVRHVLERQAHQVPLEPLLRLGVDRSPLLHVTLHAPGGQEVVHSLVVGEVGPLVAGGRIGDLGRLEEQGEPGVGVGDARAAVEHEGIEVLPDVLVIGRVLDDLQLHVDADLPELLLRQRQDLGIEERLADEEVLDREAVWMAGLGQ